MNVMIAWIYVYNKVPEGKILWASEAAYSNSFQLWGHTQLTPKPSWIATSPESDQIVLFVGLWKDESPNQTISRVVNIFGSITVNME